MKIYLFTFAIVLLMGTTAFSQISGGLKAGVNLSGMTFGADGASDESYSGTGFHFGGYATIPLSGALSFQPEILYNALSVDLDGEDLKSNYISIPAMLIYSFLDNKINIQAGPQIGFLMSTDPSEFKDEDGFTGTDFTLNVGAGASISKFNITFRYGIGLANIAGDALQAIDGISVKNNNLQISVGYKLFGE